MPTFGSLFAGIGGLDLGLEWAGWECRWQVEVDDFCRAVLARHWPGVRRYGDIRAIDWADVEPVDLIVGGFPCQPISAAGLQRAQADPRWLWPEFARAVRDLRPSLVLVENVRNLLAVNGGSAFGEVLGDLAALGFDADWSLLSAADVGAPHRRDRIFVRAWSAANADSRDGGPGRSRRPEHGREGLLQPVGSHVAADAADAVGRGRVGVTSLEGPGAVGRGWTPEGGPALADADDDARPTERGQRAPAPGSRSRRDALGGGRSGDAARQVTVLGAGQTPGVADAPGDGSILGRTGHLGRGPAPALARAVGGRPEPRRDGAVGGAGPADVADPDQARRRVVEEDHARPGLNGARHVVARSTSGGGAEGGGPVPDADGLGGASGLAGSVTRQGRGAGVALDGGAEGGGPDHGGRPDEWWAVEPDVGRVAHGVPARVDRLRALGNAVVPQVGYEQGVLMMGLYEDLGPV